MKEKINNENFTDRDWEELASALSGENSNQQELLSNFTTDESMNIEKQWNELRNMNDNKEIDVDKAWNKVWSRMNETGNIPMKKNYGVILMRSSFLKIAAVALILLSLGVAAFFLGSTNSLSKTIIVATDDNQKNYKVTLPDGSNIFLNRNTKLTYHANFGKHNRNVALSGEAFFKITHDAVKPFIIDAGKASVKVIGTSFNVITNNIDSAVEVFVQTGKVLIFNNSGAQNLVLEPGFVGTMDSKLSGKTQNNNPNYMAWNTGLLVYNGQKLDVVFKDLKRVYNMKIVADDPAILEETWTSPIDNLTQETIIRLICASFNLSFSKDGNIYHLVKK
jgi:ferric-dicitrate binding protein FerR (iron transport regulator)